MSVKNLVCQWQKSHGMFITGRSFIDPVDNLAREMERKWGVGRLRLLVSQDLREKYDKQRYLFNQAIQFGDLSDLQDQCRRMANAWLALDVAAVEANAAVLVPEVWEIALEDGSVLAICPDHVSAGAVAAQGRQVVVVTLQEIAKLYEHFRKLIEVKLQWPGAMVEKVTHDRGDPFDAIDVPSGLDVELPNDPIALI